MRAEIIAVGSELLTPQRVDTNSLFLTERLNRRGIEVVRKSIVGDDEERLTNEVRCAAKASEIVIVTGGLGPTLDDLTREAAAAALDRRLVFHPEIVEWIEERFARHGRTMSENNRRQAFVLEDADILPNPNGTAPGQYVEKDGRVLMLLPGPPREMQPMFLDHCEPRLEGIPSPYRYYTVSLRVAGLGESDVDQRIGAIYAAEKRAATTILAAPGDIQLHIRGRAESEAEARTIAEDVAQKVAAELGAHVYSWDNQPLEAVVGGLLRERGLQLALAESCTGGLLAERITSVPGSSDYFAGSLVTYATASKVNWLGVRAETIERHGAVSEETAGEMARRAMDRAGGAGKALGVGITGIAGPGGGTAETPVGSVFIAVADGAAVAARQFRFGGERDRVRLLAAQTALETIRRRLLDL